MSELLGDSVLSSAVPTYQPDLIFDVGMHRGEDTAFYLAMGFRVVAFEADPSLAQQCRERFANEIDGGRLTIVEGAITDDPGGKVKFFGSPSISEWGTTDGEWVARRAQRTDFVEITVDAVDFPAVVREYGVPHFLKIDIEGADRLCLETLGEFAARPRFVSIESEKFSAEALQGEFELFETLGYKRFAVMQQARISGRMLRTSDRLGRPLEYRFEDGASGAFGVDVGPWLDRDGAERRYRRIFRAYRLFGEDSWIRRFRIGRIVLARLPKVTGRSMPGWYDTHAMLVD
ncbi:MAG: FkbM family methyltransferase [Solirubrobacterales bacterium]